MTGCPLPRDIVPEKVAAAVERFPPPPSKLNLFLSTALAVLFTLVDSGIDVVVVCMYVCIHR